MSLILLPSEYNTGNNFLCHIMGPANNCDFIDLLSGDDVVHAYLFSFVHM